MRRRLQWRARVMVCLALLCASIVTVAGDWPTYLHDALRGAASADETLLSPDNAAHITRLWSFQTGGAVAASPTVANGTVYVGSWDGYEYALDAATGALKWQTYLGMTTSSAAHCIPASGLGVTSAATVRDGVAYVGGGGPYWYALDAASGHVLWKVYTGDNSQRGGHYNWSSPLIYNGYAYIGIASLCDRPLVRGQLLKVNLLTHRVVATFDAVPRGQVGGGVWTSPSIDTATNTLYITTGSNGAAPTTQPQAIAMVALDATTLALKASWQIPPAVPTMDSDWGDSPLLFDAAPGLPMVAAVNKDGNLYAFRRAPAGLQLLWGRPIARGGACPTCGDGSVSSGAAGAGRLYMAGGATMVGTAPYSGSVRAFDPLTGGILWEHGAARPVIGALAYANGLVVDGAGGVLEVLDAATGARLYSYVTGGALYGAPSIAEGRIFAGSTNGAIYAFGFTPSGTYSGFIGGAGRGGGYIFTPSVSGLAAIGSCDVAGGAQAEPVELAVYNTHGDLLGRAATPSACDWLSLPVVAGQTYSVVTASARAGAFRSAWSVDGAPQVWRIGGSLAAGGAQSFTFPTLSAGPITLSTCAPGGAAFGLTLLDARGMTVISGTTPAACDSLINTFVSQARGPFRLLETAASGAGAWSGTITAGRPTAGSHAGSLPANGSDSYSFVPGIGGRAVIGSCAVDTGERAALAVFDAAGRPLGHSASGSYCSWVNVTVSAGQPYTVTSSAVNGGAYRSSWSVNGAQVVWSAYGSIATPGAAASFSFPTLGAGPITLATCGPRDAAFTLTLTNAHGVRLATAARLASCQTLTYMSRARGLYRLQELSVRGAGRWLGTMTTN